MKISYSSFALALSTLTTSTKMVQSKETGSQFLEVSLFESIGVGVRNDWNGPIALIWNTTEFADDEYRIQLKRRNSVGIDVAIYYSSLEFVQTESSQSSGEVDIGEIDDTCNPFTDDMIITVENNNAIENTEGTIEYAVVDCGCPEGYTVVAACFLNGLATAADATCAAPPACFSSSATVQVLHQGVTAMKDLQVGDMVYTGMNQYQPIYAFGHYLEDVPQTFKRIFTNQPKAEPLELTSDHMLFLEHEDGSEKAVRADTIKRGDILLSEGKDVTVQKVESIEREGMYMPLTADGTIMVNGLKASAYISLQDNAPNVVQNKAYFGLKSDDEILHLWLSPVRILCLGVSSRFCGIPLDDPAAPISERGVMKWLVYGRRLAVFCEKQSFVVRVLLVGLPVFLVCGSCALMESLFGPAMAPTALVLMLVVGLVFLKQKKNGCKIKIV